VADRTRRRLSVLLLALLVGCPSADDDDTAEPPPPLTVCEGGVLASLAVEALQAPEFNSDGYQQEDDVAIDALVAGLDDLVSERFDDALERADEAGYELCRGTGDEADLVLALPVLRDSGQARIAWRHSGAAPLQLGAPHPIYDTGSLEVALAIFERTSARLLVVSGTHRCASLVESPCSGSTLVCGGGNAPYRISDPAHWDRTVFHRAAVRLARSFPDDWVASIHSMSVYPGISVSDGTWGELDVGADPTPAAARVWAALVQAFPLDYVSTCNEGLGVEPDRRLCGTSNLQGRAVNGVSEVDLCTLGADLGSGRFVHQEMAYDLAEATASQVGDAWCVALPGCG